MYDLTRIKRKEKSEDFSSSVLYELSFDQRKILRRSLLMFEVIIKGYWV